MIWIHLRHSEHPTQKNVPEGLQHLWAEQKLLIPLQDIFQSHRLMASGIAHDKCYTAHFQKGDRTTKNEDKEKQRKTGLGVSNAIENL